MIRRQDQTAKNVVLLTAAVSPTAAGPIVIRDPALRLRQYQVAIAQWAATLRDSPFRLAVVETTGEPRRNLLDHLDQHSGAGIRYLEYKPTPAEVIRGKGAVEMAAVRYAIEQDLVQPEGTVYKCTGRLTVVNAKQILTPIPTGAVRVRITADHSWVDTRLLGAARETWCNHFFRDSHLIDDRSGRYIERVLAARLGYASTLHEIHLQRFTARPFFDGMSGTTGRTYAWRFAQIRDRLLRPIETLIEDIATRKQV